MSKVIRVIRQPRGNMLLIGIGGSGRTSLSRLASFICEYTTFQVEITKHYRKQEFRDGKTPRAQPCPRLHVHSHCVHNILGETFVGDQVSQKEMFMQIAIL